MDNDLKQKTMDVTTYSCPNIMQSLYVKGATVGQMPVLRYTSRKMSVAGVNKPSFPNGPMQL